MELKRKWSYVIDAKAFLTFNVPQRKLKMLCVYHRTICMNELNLIKFQNMPINILFLKPRKKLGKH